MLYVLSSLRCGLKSENFISSTTTTTTAAPLITPHLVKGDYCIDYDINYEEGDEFKKIRNVESIEACRQLCLKESECKYYVWKGASRRKQCLLKSSGLWIPKYESGTISGTVEGQCQEQRTEDYGLCDCVELAPDYYDEDFIDLVESGLINPKFNTCPPEQGRRCYFVIKALPSSNNGFPGISSRITFG